MPVPNTNDFTFLDVAPETQSWTLDLAFQYATASKFDLRYQGNKDRLTNFRNYGWSGNISEPIDMLIKDWGFDDAPLLMDQVPGSPYFLAAYHNPLPQSDSGGFLPHNPYFRLGNTNVLLLGVTTDGKIFEYPFYLPTIWREYPTDLLMINDEYAVLATQEYSVDTLRLYNYNLRLIKFSTQNQTIEVTDITSFRVSNTDYPNNVRIAYDGNGHLFVINFDSVNFGGNNYIYKFSVSFDIENYPIVRKFGTPVQAATFTDLGGDIYIQGNNLFLSRIISGNNVITVYNISSSGNLTFLGSWYTSQLVVDMDGNKEDTLFLVSRKTVYVYQWTGTSLLAKDSKPMSTTEKLFPSISYSQLNNIMITSNEDLARTYRVNSSFTLILEDTYNMTDNTFLNNQIGRPYCVRNNFNIPYVIFGMWDRRGGGEYRPSDFGADYNGTYLRSFEIT